jgi:hypothetical protein
VVYAALSPHDQAAILGWASTNVHNLRHHPVGSLVASAFVTSRGSNSMLSWRTW